MRKFIAMALLGASAAFFAANAPAQAMTAGSAGVAKAAAPADATNLHDVKKRRWHRHRGHRHRWHRHRGHRHRWHRHRHHRHRWYRPYYYGGYYPYYHRRPRFGIYLGF